MRSVLKATISNTSLQVHLLQLSMLLYSKLTMLQGHVLLHEITHFDAVAKLFPLDADE